ncbi:MAG: hypothetical protein IE881_05545 [Epsilonproteobacteria bacterium]|nr:hypothetical protein [Campylobacterota bacterium]
MGRLVTSTGLLLLAISGMVIFAIPTFIVQLIRYIALKKLELHDYFYKLAKSLDYLGATLIFGTMSRTISALTFEKNIKWAIVFIDWIFYKGHCKDAYKQEVKIVQ